MNKKQQIKSILAAINKEWQKHWLWYLIGGLALCVILFVYSFRAVMPFPTLPQIVSDATKEPEVVFRHPLTGEKSASEIVRPRVFGVMVENSADAWPISGVEDAFLVIEAPVEANIPRLEAFYFDGQPAVEKIGPVRSARPYYLDWAQELDAIYAHCGGSPEALNLIASGDILDLNEFWNSQYFWRSPGRFAPHNVYTSTELLNLVLANREETSKIDYGLWNFKDDSPAENPSNADLIIEDGFAYKTEWRYDATVNNYTRWQNGNEVKSEDGDSILANNVAVVYTPISILDSIGRREVETVGEGEALVFQDGRKITAVWEKKSADERLRFYAEDGKEIIWNAGVTWIEVVSTTTIK